MEGLLWLVLDDNKNLLWFGRGTLEEATAGAKASSKYNAQTTLILYTVNAEIIIEPK